MLLPRIQTHPAEIKFAFTALHVIAAFVFLDRRLAIGTRFTVGHQPVAVGRLLAFRARCLQLLRFDGHHFVQPLQPLVTAGWCVRLLQTLPAEKVTATAVDSMRSASCFFRRRQYAQHVRLRLQQISINR